MSGEEGKEGELEEGLEFPGRMLHQAAIFNNVDFLADLLKGEEAEAINSQDPFGRTALYTAVTNNSLDCARMLLDAGADPNIACGPRCSRMTPLHAAALEDKQAFLQLLLRAGADLDAPDASGETPRDLAKKYCGDEGKRVINEEIERRKERQADVERELVEACMELNMERAGELVRGMTEGDVSRIINEIQAGQTSLLHRACEGGHAEMASFLLEHGAREFIHPVTGHSSLHAACQAGQAGTARVIMQHFPELVQSPTIEGTLPLHMAAAEGHLALVNLILHFTYPRIMRQIYRDHSTDNFYKLGFPINAKDGRSHSALHTACINDRADVVKALLTFQVKIVDRESFNTSSDSETQIEDAMEDEEGGGGGGAEMGVEESEVASESPDVSEATEDLHEATVARATDQVFHPVDVDSLDLDGRTPLHLAVRGDGHVGYYHVAELLLDHGANPNKPIISPSGNSSPLMEACITGDVDMIDLLLKHKANDTDLKVLSAATISNNSHMSAVLLKYKTYTDSEYKINKQAIQLSLPAAADSEQVDSEEMSDSVTGNSPCHPTTVNWHALNLQVIEGRWLEEAALLQNPHLTPHRHVSLHTITRIDVSNNNLMSIPREVFLLKSLRLLNLSENKMSGLPGDTSRYEGAVVVYNGTDTDTPLSPAKPFHWDLPLLEEFQCYKNKLKTVPAEIFRLPGLKRLNLSQNEVERLPLDMWKAPALLELNLAYNRLRELPVGFSVSHQGSSDSLSLDSNDNPDDTTAMSNSGPGLSNSGPGLSSSGPGLSSSGSALSNSGAALSNSGSASSGPGLSSSGPGTPRKASTSTSNASSHGSSSGTSDQTTTSDEPAASPLLISPGRSYMEHDVEQVSYWRDNIRLRPSLGVSDTSDKNNKSNSSPLQELNVSHNLFDSVPTGLPCLTPNLSKLIMSHNRLSHVGALSLYPASLKLLDLSHNTIINHVLFECIRFDDDHFTERWATRTCYNPSPRKMRASRASNGNSGSPSLMMGPGSSPRLSTSSSSSPSTSSSSHCCSHRSHMVLEQLRTLKLDHNKLSTLTLILDTGEKGSEGLDDLPRSPSKASLRRISGQSDSGTNPGCGQRPSLMYPGLTVLDISYNQLTSMTSEISQMTGLTELKMGHNRLHELPPEMGLLRKLWNLDISGNPVERSLSSLLGDKSKKTAAILGYLKSIKDEATLYNRMKLMFVGVQGIGKTSLLSQLRKEGRSSTTKSKNWAQRMGHGSIKDKDLKGDNISTVGVDIGDLVLQRGSKEIIFSTWDFGGQREYYATHQYFLSKRSLYLVCWKVTDGERGVTDIMQWLVNIQARAPNSPVIIVGTHRDLVNKRNFPETYLRDMQCLLEDKYMKHSEPEKWGLPRVIGHVEVSCRPSLMARSHIGDLVSLICTISFEEQWPGSKGVRLVEQKVPASYVHLQDVVSQLGEERKMEGKDPVLHTEQYRFYVMERMEKLYNSSFRDIAELNQATQFLHENGVLLHYDDVNLQDVYFLDPQWLCDMLANVVTIREINSLAKSGIMRTEDLKLQFKNADFKPEDIKTYIIDLLNKFEVALLWDDHNLLIPSLLPAETDLRHNYPFTDIRIPVRGCSVPELKPHYGTGEHIIQSGVELAPSSLRAEGRSTFYIDSTAYHPHQALMDESNQSDEGTVDESNVNQEGDTCEPRVTNNPNPAVALVRLYLMSYFPSGFWPRLITRLLGDNTLYNLILSLYDLPDVLVCNDDFMTAWGSCPEWKCWQTGVELRYMDVVLARLKEAPRSNPNTFCDYRQAQMVMRQEEVEGGVAVLNLDSTAILEILFPNESITVQFDGPAGSGAGPAGSGGFSESIVIQPSPQITAGLLAKIVDHVDTLLEDWYPDLGARFIQNSRGMYLITRVVPCTRCVLRQKDKQAQKVSSNEAWSIVDVNQQDDACITEPIYIDKHQQAGTKPDTPLIQEERPVQIRYGSAPPGPAGPGGPEGTWVDSMYSSGVKVVQTVGSIYNKTAEATGILPKLEGFGCGGSQAEGDGRGERVYCYLVEQCLQAAQQNKVVFCPLHGNMGPYFIASRQGHVTSAHVSPDSVFQDIGDQYHIDPDQIWLGHILGRGAFGAVFSGSMVDKRTGEMVEIAMKMLQPVDPGQTATPSQKQQYNAERLRWEKDPMKNACEAYLNARKELSILLSLHHQHIVPLLGVALQPLCLVLSLAPQGALSSCLREYRRAGARLPISIIQAIIIQVSSALAYLHSCQIIYRDLKSENVLVWALPPPASTESTPAVHVKLADYGVSRAVLPSGTKGFAGTPPFIAPEIIQHSGEESYTEKVDCFSFGMFIYELLMLRLPFEDGDSGAAAVANLKGHILAGGRPPLTYKELTYSNHVLDLMTLCWSHDPAERPSAEQIRSIASCSEFSHLQDVVAMETQCEVVSACTAPSPHDSRQLLDTRGEDEDGPPCFDVWVSTKSLHDKGSSLSVYTYLRHRCVHMKTLQLDGTSLVISMCLAGPYIWLADTAGIIHIFRHSDYTEVLKFPVTTTPNVHIRTMVYGVSEGHVFVVLDTGRLVVCGTVLPSNLPSRYTPVRTECPGNNRPIHCLAALPTLKGSSELWCGQSRGKISVWNLHTESGSMKVINHPDVTNESSTVVHLATDRTRHRMSNAVWSYVYPGTEIYRWDAMSHTLTGKMDISIAMPRDDPILQIVVEDGRIIPMKTQVSALCVLGTELFIGTTMGCVVVADCLSMETLHVCRSHGEDAPYVRAILPFITALPHDHYDPLEVGEKWSTGGVVSVGSGYNDIIMMKLNTAPTRPGLKYRSVILSWTSGKWAHGHRALPTQ